MKFYVFITSFILILFLSVSSVSASVLEDPQDVLSVEDVPGDVVPEDTSDENQCVQQIDISPLSDQMVSNNFFNEFSLVIDYVKGLLLNMSNDIDYLFFPVDVDGISHYYLFYDLDFDEFGNVILKDYPCYDIYVIDDVFYQNSSFCSLFDVPTFAYGSFGSYSALIDKQFHFNDFYVVVVGLMIMFIMFRKRVFT